MNGILCLALLFLFLGTRASHRHAEHLANEIDQEIEGERKLLIECQHNDYRAYIRCLKREKRQHHGAGLGNTRACLDECFGQNCTNSTCLRDCHSHCRKRLIETYSKTVETSFDCAGGECEETRTANSPNVTTYVNVINVIPNNTGCGEARTDCRQPCRGKDAAKCGDSGEDCRDCAGQTRQKVAEPLPKIDINNIINNQLGPGFYPGADCACPGCNCYPYNPWQSSPQITIGIGGGPIGGCMYPLSWPCFQRFPTPPIDCSMCSNPFFRYRCDPSCLQDPRRNYTQPPTAALSLSSSNSLNNKWPKKQR